MEESIEKSLILIKLTREEGEAQATHSPRRNLHNCKDTELTKMEAEHLAFFLSEG